MFALVDEVKRQLDAARDEQVLPAILRSGLTHRSLYEGWQGESLADRLEREGTFTFTSMFRFAQPDVEMTYAEIKHEAVVTLLAQRIGHGTTLLQDPEVTALVIERGVTIEACPTSNVHTGVLAKVADHPLARRDQPRALRLRAGRRRSVHRRAPPPRARGA